MAAPQSLLKYDDPVVVNAEYAPEKSAKVRATAAAFYIIITTNNTMRNAKHTRVTPG